MLLKLRAYLLLLLYLGSAIGLVVDFHYCGGELAKVAFYQADEDDCCGAHTKQKPDCCEDHYFCMDTDDSEGAKVFTIGQPALSVFLLPVVHSLLKPEQPVCLSLPVTMDHAPPDGKGNALYLQHRVLLI